MAATSGGGEVVNMTFGVGVAGAEALPPLSRTFAKLGADAIFTGKAIESLVNSQERLRASLSKGALEKFDLDKLKFGMTKENATEFNRWSNSVKKFSNQAGKPTIAALDKLILEGERLSETFKGKKGVVGIRSTVKELKGLRAEMQEVAFSAKLTTGTIDEQAKATANATRMQAKAASQSVDVMGIAKTEKKFFDQKTKEEVTAQKNLDKLQKEDDKTFNTRFKEEESLTKKASQRQNKLFRMEIARVNEKKKAEQEVIRLQQQETKLAKQGPMQRATEEQSKQFEKLQMASQSALLGMSLYTTATDLASGKTEALKGDILGLGLSLIFLRFAYQSMAQGLAHGAIIAGVTFLGSELIKLFTTAKDMKKFSESLGNLGVPLANVARDTEQVRSIAKLMGVEWQVVGKAAQTLAANGIDPLSKSADGTTDILQTLAKISQATGKDINDIAGAFISVIKPGDMSIGTLDEFRASLITLLGIGRTPEGGKLIDLFVSLRKIVGSPLATLEAGAERGFEFAEFLKTAFTHPLIDMKTEAANEAKAIGGTAAENLINEFIEKLSSADTQAKRDAALLEFSNSLLKMFEAMMLSEKNVQDLMGIARELIAALGSGFSQHIPGAITYDLSWFSEKFKQDAVRDAESIGLLMAQAANRAFSNSLSFGVDPSEGFIGPKYGGLLDDPKVPAVAQIAEEIGASVNEAIAEVIANNGGGGTTTVTTTTTTEVTSTGIINDPTINPWDLWSDDTG